ncbi:pentapeptide repeat-containing protein [Chamaesiphon polymorphus]|nr:pentapeptide repeat-containing protein [Chamaesiphon polymorphus]
MSNLTPKASRRVRFEEVTPAHEYAAFFNVSIASLVAHLGLPIFDGYDDLDDLQLAFLTLPSGETVTLGEYAGAPGTSLYVDVAMQNIPEIIFDSCRQLRVSRQEIEWIHPDWQVEFDSLLETLRERLYAQHGEVEGIDRSSTILSQSKDYEPIDCFYYALDIYTREKLPEYWATLQHNLGLAYFDRLKGERRENLQKSIECFNKSLEVFTQEEFPEKWKMNQIDLRTSVLRFKIFQKTIEQILDRPIKYKDLQGFDLSGANLNYADMFGANLNRAKLVGAKLRQVNLSNADLSDADLSGADLSGANLSGANLSDTTKVDKAQFGYNLGISESMRQELIARGAIFEDVSGDRSESRTLVPR